MQHNTNYVYAACSKDSESTLNQFWQMWIDRRKEMYNIRILSQSIFTHMCSVEIWSLYVDWNCRHSIFHCNIFPCYFYEYCLHPKRRFIHNFSILARNYCFFPSASSLNWKRAPGPTSSYSNQMSFGIFAKALAVLCFERITGVVINDRVAEVFKGNRIKSGIHTLGFSGFYDVFKARK